MKGRTAKQDIDSVLLCFLKSTDETEANNLLEQLVCGCAQPVIAEIVGFKLRAYPTRKAESPEQVDAEDVASEVLVRLVRRLRDLRASPHDTLMRNLRSYAAVMAYRACDEYLRKKYPHRHSLKNKLRYLLTHREGLALWESEDTKWFCGFAVWRDQRRSVVPLWKLNQLRDNPQAFAGPMLTHHEIGAVNPADLLAAIFDRAGDPLELDDLVTVVADLWHIEDRPPENIGEIHTVSNLSELAFDPRRSLDTALDRRAHIERLWAEICQLPPKQRIALLLNLKDSQGRSVVALLPITRIAGIRQIAEALEMSAEHLVAIWDEMPFDDATIAERLSVTRQQVINLRKSARERLARRTRAFDGDG